MRPKVSIIIVNWNGAVDTLECVESLEKITYSNYEIIIVDNGSADSDIKQLKNSLDKRNVSLILNDTNKGFTGGNNIGINAALKNNSDFVLLLNNDTVVESDFLEPLVELFDKYEKTGITAPQINYYDKRNFIWSEGGKISKIRGSGFAYSDKPDENKIKDDKIVSFASGCCLLIRREILEKIGQFDENFFLYVEDTDLCFRTLTAGFKIIITHNSKIYHKVGASTNKNLSGLPLYYVTRNRLFFAKKSFNYFYPFTFIYIIIAMFLKGILWTISGKFENIIMVQNAFYDFYKGKMGKTFQNKYKAKL